VARTEQSGYAVLVTKVVADTVKCEPLAFSSPEVVKLEPLQSASEFLSRLIANAPRREAVSVTLTRDIKPDWGPVLEDLYSILNTRRGARVGFQLCVLVNQDGIPYCCDVGSMTVLDATSDAQAQLSSIATYFGGTNASAGL